jgi:MoxR-like ATPase
MTDEIKLEETRGEDQETPEAAELRETSPAPAPSTAGLELTEAIIAEVRKRIVGQEYMVERILLGLLTGGHVLLEGVPGLAKTLTIRTIAETIDTSFQRIQFTPDLLPADLVGTMIYNQKTAEFEPRRGPLFANIILADEVNRAPAKVQSALLEAMQEKQVTFGGSTFILDEPFLVLATQNPIEQEGTYPLPEAQVDRFMLKVTIGYPSRSEEKEIMMRMATGDVIEVDAVTEPEAIFEARSEIVRLYMDDKIADYIVDLVHATREPAEYGVPELTPLIEYGASPRATIYIAQTSRAHAYLRGRGYVIPDDVKAVAPDVLRHRIITTYEAEAEEVTSEEITRRILEAVEVP